MEDMVPKLLARIKSEYSQGIDRLLSDSAVEKIMESVNYEDAYSYARSIAEILAKAMGDNITADILPDGKMYYNIANRVIPEMYKQAYEDTIAAATIIQDNVNEAAEINLKVITPDFNEDRTRAIVDKISDAEDFDKAKWLLEKPVIENLTQSGVDDTIKINAEFQSKSGIKAKIVRTEYGGCCKWCNKLAGSYAYPDVPDDVYRRHKNCRCTVKYIPIKGGKAQDVWTKKWENADLNRLDQVASDEAFLEEFEKRKRIAKANGEYCIDATEKWKRGNTGAGVIRKNDKQIVVNGVSYIVDNKWVKFEPSAREKEVAELFIKNYGGNITLNPKINEPPGIQLADYTYKGQSLDLKSIKGKSEHVLYGITKKHKNQSNMFIYDISSGSISEKEAVRQITGDVFRSNRTGFVNTAFLIKDSTFLGVFERV